MIVYIARRLATALAVMWLAVSLAFIALRWVPGDAVDATMARSGASPAEMAARRSALGLDDPIWRQYLAYLAGVLRGRWGESLVSGQPVGAMIGQNLGPTAALASSALLVAVTLGMSLGVLVGVVRWRFLRYPAEAVASLALSTPVYWTATLAIYLFTTALGLLPGVGGEGVRYLILPACVLGFHTAGSIAQVTANSIRDAARQDFMRTARAKGLPEWDVLDHVLRVGLLPVIAVVALQLGFLLGGTVITETIFVRRGLGRILLSAISDRDYPVIQGVVALSALVYSLTNALADVMYRIVDPRVARDQ
ncbi:MAG TPA: ABC transporter permease [Aggregatilineaceae bacterium]|nr:ABC transporter permease [Aggregatilineaceae bacterium]